MNKMVKLEDPRMYNFFFYFIYVLLLFLIYICSLACFLYLLLCSRWKQGEKEELAKKVKFNEKKKAKDENAIIQGYESYILL